MRRRVSESTSGYTCFLNVADRLGWKRARRGSQRDTYDEREKSGRVNSRRFRARWRAQRRRRHQHKQRAAHNRAGCRVTGAHRAIVPHRIALSVAITFSLLRFADLTMVHRAIHGITAYRQTGGGQRFGKRGNTGKQQCEQRRDRLEFSRHLPQSHGTRGHNDTPFPGFNTTAR